MVIYNDPSYPFQGENIDFHSTHFIFFGVVHNGPSCLILLCQFIMARPPLIAAVTEFAFCTFLILNLLCQFITVTEFTLCLFLLFPAPIKLMARPAAFHAANHRAQLCIFYFSQCPLIYGLACCFHAANHSRIYALLIFTFPSAL